MRNETSQQLQEEYRQIERQMDEQRERLTAIRGELARRKRDEQRTHTSVTIDSDGRYSR